MKILPQVVMNMAETEGEIECAPAGGIDNLSRETEDIKKDQWRFRNWEIACSAVKA